MKAGPGSARGAAIGELRETGSSEGVGTPQERAATKGVSSVRSD